MKPALSLAACIALTAFGLSGCLSTSRHTADDDRAECQAQGYAPGSKGFADCVVDAGARHDEAAARQDLGMRQMHDQEVDNFLTSTSIHP
jgi:hypothetical protein